MFRQLVGFLIVSCAYATPVSPGNSLAPLHVGITPGTQISDSYIVVLQDSADISTHASFVQTLHRFDAPSASRPNSTGLTHIYDGPIKGYSGKFSNDTMTKIRALPDVNYVEQDQVMHVTDIEKQAPWVSL